MSSVECAQNPGTVREYNIPAYLRDAAEAKVTKVNRRIEKLGLTPYQVTFTPGPMKPNYDDSGCRTVINGIPHYFEQGRPVPCPIIDWEATVDVTITGELPRLGDWEPVAILTRELDGPPSDGPAPVITRVFPGLQNDPDLTQFRGTDPVCEHCRTIRDRIDTFVVRHRVTGQMMQVGRNCLAAYTGIDLKIPTWLYTDGIDEMDEWSDTQGGGGEPYLTVLDVLEATCGVAAKFGWVSRQTERDSMGTRIATAEIVMAVMRGRTPGDAELRKSLAGTVPQAGTAVEVRAHAVSMAAEGSEYATNLAAIAAGEWVSLRNVPLLCSAYAAWVRARKEYIERATRPESNWQGTVEEKLIGLVLTVTHTSVQEKHYGYSPTYSTLIGMIDKDGNKYKWWATGTWNYTPGTILTLNGTVKKHDLHEGVKETVLTRCKVTAKTTPEPAVDTPATSTPDIVTRSDQAGIGWHCRTCDSKWSGARTDHTPTQCALASGDRTSNGLTVGTAA
jgi:hypothetical protein